MLVKLKPDCIVDTLWDGDIRMTIRGDLSEEILHHITNNKIDYLVLESGSYKKIHKLLSVKEKILKLTISTNLPDWSFVSSLSYLRNLMIEGDFKNCTIDFSRLSQLIHLKIYWNKEFENKLDRAINLKTLFIINYKGKDLKFLGSMNNLEFLELYNSRKLVSLTGMSKLINLCYFEANGIPKLSDVCELTKLNNLLYLSLSKCKNNYSYNCLSKLKSVKQIFIGGEMKEIKWVSSLSKLEFFSMDCKLTDGNLNFLFEMKKLKLVLFNNKKNYSIALQEIQSFLESKGYNQSELRLMRTTFADGY